MEKHEIVAGQVKQIKSDCGEWFIVDIGMRMDQPSCGVWHGPETLDVITFAELKKRVIEAVECGKGDALNLLIEAPLSVVWRPDKNPGVRACDRWKWSESQEEFRHWHFNSGAATLLAASFLLRELHECKTRARTVRLFEGHVSFKTGQGQTSNKRKSREAHKTDVLALKAAVWHGTRRRIFTREELVPNDRRSFTVESAFPFFDRNLVPPVIRVNPMA